MAPIDIRPLRPADLDVVPQAFAAAGWPGKRIELYRDYLRQQESGLRRILVASLGNTFAGYLTVCWASSYPPFRTAGIPEIQDFNVLPESRRHGVGSALVGLYAAYGAAQRLYARRGYVPDGRGVVYRNVAVEPGASVTVDDDLVLMMTRRLRAAARPAGRRPASM
jgi:GNAT superfamily N-acetyltransferase